MYLRKGGEDGGHEGGKKGKERGGGKRKGEDVEEKGEMWKGEARCQLFLPDILPFTCLVCSERKPATYT